MKISKAVITAAGPDQQHLPLQTLVSSSGETKTVLSLLLDEAVGAGIKEVGIVIAPGTQHDFETAVDGHLEKVTFIEQREPLGFGHAVLTAQDFVGSDSFLLLVGDHLYLSREDRCCMSQLIETATRENCPVSAVQATHESQLPYYGVVGGKRIPGSSDLYDVEIILEKPSPTDAEQSLIIPGLRAGSYLCFFGTHVLTSSVMAELKKSFSANSERLPLTPSLCATAQNERYLALEIEGRRFNIGEPYGLLRANLGMALAGPERDEVMGTIIELIAETR
ncbi:sugar phosphate nucleotidyltransferase [Akkermansiaceae bacterium]|nr:sugar phosphate nucleotidyltransferase [Akkermansiaceae bacterium]MDB4505381.1 sugar phosphate nucleotidyltransferase [bacterium]MDB0068336.1 sugar phosphate nucleotidyltransferase [Akkermansiaceae bacterium]MDB4295413.1 sugar phosphate nucleotidyltransferase [Akkermansiaceae bacterium]MDB4377591.1 sugar phosphate nucleotidyltransferase [Akkermansiaceae bacterium]